MLFLVEDLHLSCDGSSIQWVMGFVEFLEQVVAVCKSGEIHRVRPG